MEDLLTKDHLRATVHEIVSNEPIVDMHTHLYPPSFGTPVPNATGRTDPAGLMLWGIDELVTYHYLVAEVYRIVPATKLPYEQFWKMSKRQQADHIWKHLFAERTPISEACRGVLTALQTLGLDASDRDLNRIRKWFDAQEPNQYIDRVMQASKVRKITMTNPVFDDNERQRWLSGAIGVDSRFSAVLRIDPLLRAYPEAAKKLSSWGYKTGNEIDQKSIDEAKRFLTDWIDRQKAIYLAVSLPPEFRYPTEGDHAAGAAAAMVLEKIILPVCADRRLPFAMMIGSRMRVNPALGDAGDMVGRSDVQSVVRLCRDFPQNKFFVTMLARENQHELAVAARKFGNLMLFGCWWFLNNPSLIDEITRMRVELLGTSFIPQHSDSRVLDQLAYKWPHSRKIVADVLSEKYLDTMETGWRISRSEIEQDVKRLLSGNFLEFLGR